MNKISCIGVDWGTTNFRAWSFDSNGEIIESISRSHGILVVPNGGFEDVLLSEIGGWLAADEGIPVVASGMVTARQGWVEVAYQHCPVSVSDLSKAGHRLTLRTGHPMLLIGGVDCVHGDGFPDVMRGEETQIIGLASRGQDLTELVILPGTHSKWVTVDKLQRITAFDTFMTGEIFSLLSRQSILRHSVSEEPARFLVDKFLDGVETAKQTGGRILNSAFHIRTLSLWDRLSPDEARDYLSGLLIGSEIVDAIARNASTQSTDTMSISTKSNDMTGSMNPTLLGDGDLVARYQTALTAFGFKTSVAASDTTARGLWSIFQSTTF